MRKGETADFQVLLESGEGDAAIDAAVASVSGNLNCNIADRVTGGAIGTQAELNHHRLKPVVR